MPTPEGPPPRLQLLDAPQSSAPALSQALLDLGARPKGPPGRRQIADAQATDAALSHNTRPAALSQNTRPAQGQTLQRHTQPLPGRALPIGARVTRNEGR